MAMQTILVAASGGSASTGAIELAFRLAQRMGAHLEGFHVKVDPVQVVALASDGFNMPIAGDWIDRLIADTDALAEKTRTEFVAAAGQHGLSLTAGPRAAASASWRVEAGDAPMLVARRARYFDLIVLGRSERVVDRPHSDTIEETLVGSGRPVLLAPSVPPSVVGETVALGWNGSPEAVHALAATLPLLAKAHALRVVTVGDVADDSVAPLLDYLACHGIAATHREVAPVRGVGPGEQLLAEARDLGADLLVMGAYGHRPWREILFGGATRHIVGSSLLPILLAH